MEFSSVIRLIESNKIWLQSCYDYVKKAYDAVNIGVIIFSFFLNLRKIVAFPIQTILYSFR